MAEEQLKNMQEHLNKSTQDYQRKMIDMKKQVEFFEIFCLKIKIGERKNLRFYLPKFLSEFYNLKLNINFSLQFNFNTGTIFSGILKKIINFLKNLKKIFLN